MRLSLDRQRLRIHQRLADAAADRWGRSCYWLADRCARLIMPGALVYSVGSICELTADGAISAACVLVGGYMAQSGAIASAARAEKLWRATAAPSYRELPLDGPLRSASFYLAAIGVGLATRTLINGWFYYVLELGALALDAAAFSSALYFLACLPRPPRPKPAPVPRGRVIMGDGIA